MPQPLAPRRAVLWLAAALCLTALAPAPAHAQIGPDELGFDVPVAVAEAGRGAPMVSFSPAAKLSGVVMQLVRSDGKKLSVRVGNLAPGREKRVPIRQEKGVFGYVATLTGKGPGGAFGPFELTFELKVGAAPRIGIRAEDVDLDAGQLTVRSSEKQGKVELQVWDAEGAPLDDVEQAYDAAPGSPIVVRWKQKKGQVAGRFSMKVYDVAGFWSGVESVTFVNIPHEDVVFESGKWEIRPEEATKLEKPLARIVAELRKVQGVLPISLYVAGYTDTVGSAADNLELSRKRADAIAAWFRKRGLKIPILAQGFGESALFVQTPDNTDEARNRRAVYVLSPAVPPASAGFPGRAWKRM
ncbi:MAG: hypothetical protein RIT45_973 [Pseudomonadota bacterium]|jgi:outer membrane protein OmpA-like peptidoglycan-associated protein